MAKGSKRTVPTTFKVVLDGLNLSHELSKQIERDIKRVVMQHLASIDLKGDLVISPLGPNGGGTTGIHAGNGNGP